MKSAKIVLTVIIILGFVFPMFAQSENDSSYSILLNEFKANTDLWKQAYNSKDAKNLIPLYTEDANYISSHVSGLEANGRDKLIANFQNGMNMGGYIDLVEILSMNVSCDIVALLCK